MKFSRWSFFCLLSVLALASATVVRAQVVPITSYSYLSSPSGGYPDNGGELTDGNAVVHVWPDFSSFDTSPLVGWQNTEGRIRFDFGSAVTIRSATFHFADSNGGAGVFFPANISLSNASNTFVQSFSLADPDGSGNTVAATVGGFEVTTDHLILVIPADINLQWQMISEASFSASAIPEPSTYAMMAGTLALVAAAVMRSRQRQNRTPAE